MQLYIIKEEFQLKSFSVRYFNWGVARINLYKIDKGMLEPVHFFPAIGDIDFLFRNSGIGTDFSLQFLYGLSCLVL
jgi:hypothetical protein